MGQCCKYKYSRGADGCCQISENSGGLHESLLLITSNFQGLLFFPKYSESVISFQTPCGQIQMWTRNNTLILPNILADMHMPLFQLHLNCWDSSKTACHVTHTLRFSLWILANGSSDCLFCFKQMTTHRPDLCFETFLVMFSSFTEFDVSQNI